MFTTIGMIAALILAIIFLVRGCSTSDRFGSRIDSLTEKQAMLESERDSLKRELENRRINISNLAGEREDLKNRIKELEGRMKALSATSAARAARLKEAESENRELEGKYSAEAGRAAALRGELKDLNSRLADVQEELGRLRRDRDALLAENRMMEEKRMADSIAEAAKPEPVPERTYGWFVNSLELGGAYGLSVTAIDYTNWFAGITNVFGYAFSTRMTGGLGTGFQVYNGGAMVPLYLDFRYAFSSRRWTPFLVADGGLVFPLESLKMTGPFISPSVGLQRTISGRSALHLSAGVFTQMTPTTSRSTFILLRAGYTFNNR